MSCLVACALVALAADHSTDSYRSGHPASPENALRLEQFLDLGFEKTRSSNADLERAYRELATGTSPDPALRYALAVSFLKRNDYDAARKILDELRELQHPPYVPAWRASIWQSFIRRDVEAGCTLLSEFARLTADQAQSWSIPDQPERNAEWIGQLMSALDFQIRAGSDLETLQNLWMDIENRFDGPLRNRFHAGIEQTQELRLRFEEQVSETREIARAEQEQQIENQSEEILTQAEQAERQKEQLKLTAKEWKDKLDKELQEFGKQIGTLERDYKFHETKLASLERSITLAQRELNITQLELQQLQAARQNPQGNRTVRLTSGRDFNQLIADENRMLQLIGRYQVEYRDAYNNLQQIAARGNQLLAARQALIGNYQNATGELVKADHKLDRLAKKLSREQQQLAELDPTSDTTEIKKLRTRMNQFQTYVSFDLDEEKTYLIDAHTPPPTAPIGDPS